MDFTSLISRNKERTDAIFCATPFKLVKSEATPLRLREQRFESHSLVVSHLPKPKRDQTIATIAPVPVIDERSDRAKERPVDQLPAPKSHKQWYNYCTLSGHNAWVQCAAVDPSNEFFVTGSFAGGFFSVLKMSFFVFAKVD